MDGYETVGMLFLNEQVSVGLGYVFVETLNVNEAVNLVRYRTPEVVDCRPHVFEAFLNSEAAAKFCRSSPARHHAQKEAKGIERRP